MPNTPSPPTSAKSSSGSSTQGESKNAVVGNQYRWPRSMFSSIAQPTQGASAACHDGHAAERRKPLRTPT